MYKEIKEIKDYPHEKTNSKGILNLFWMTYFLLNRKYFHNPII